MTPDQARRWSTDALLHRDTILTCSDTRFSDFEISVAQTLVCAATAYIVEIILETAGAWSENRKPLFVGGFKQFVIFLMPAHITGLAVSMLLYAGDRDVAVYFCRRSRDEPPQGHL